MNTKTKRRIAKEIIYFFSVIILLLLAWAGFEIRNTYLKNKIDNLSEEVSYFNSQIDSIEGTFPKKAKSFNELIDEKSRKRPTLKLVNKDGLPLFKKSNNAFIVLDEDLPSITILYRYLIENKFDLSNPYSLSEEDQAELDRLNKNVPIEGDNGLLPPPPSRQFVYFEDLIKKEFDQTKQPYIEKIYNFIKTKNSKFTCSISSFVFCLKELPEPSIVAVEKLAQLKNSKTEINQKLKETHLLDGSDIRRNIFLCSIILFGTLYPLRFVFLLLVWAFKTVKQKE